MRVPRARWWSRNRESSRSMRPGCQRWTMSAATVLAFSTGGSQSSGSCFARSALRVRDSGSGWGCGGGGWLGVWGKEGGGGEGEGSALRSVTLRVTLSVTLRSARRFSRNRRARTAPAVEDGARSASIERAISTICSPLSPAATISARVSALTLTLRHPRTYLSGAGHPPVACRPVRMPPPMRCTAARSPDRR